MAGLDTVREQYPTLAWLFNHPEVGPLLKKAVDINTGFNPQTFQAKLYQTKYFRSRSASQRAAEILRHTDPGEYRQRMGDYAFSVRQTATRLGVRLTNAQIKYAAADALRRGFSPDDPRLAFGIARLRNKKNATAGAIRTFAKQSQAVAKGLYYIPLSTKSAANWGSQIARGTRTMEDLQAEMQRKAMSRFPHLSAQLEAGQTMDDIFAGHKAIIAEELEISPNLIDLSKSRWSKVIDTYDREAKKHRPYSLYETRILAREDPRFWKTQHGQAEDSAMASFVAKTFGKRA